MSMHNQTAHQTQQVTSSLVGKACKLVSAAGPILQGSWRCLSSRCSSHTGSCKAWPPRCFIGALLLSSCPGACICTSVNRAQAMFAASSQQCNWHWLWLSTALVMIRCIAAMRSAWALLARQREVVVATVLAAHPALTTTLRAGERTDAVNIPHAGRVLLCRPSDVTSAEACAVDAPSARSCMRTLVTLGALPWLQRLQVSGTVAAHQTARAVASIATLTQLTALEIARMLDETTVAALEQLSGLQRLVQLVVVAPVPAGWSSCRPGRMSSATTTLATMQGLLSALPALQHLGLQLPDSEPLCTQYAGVDKQRAARSQVGSGLRSLDLSGLQHVDEDAGTLPSLLATVPSLTSLRVGLGASRRLRFECGTLRVLTQLQRLETTWDEGPSARLPLSCLQAVTHLALQPDSPLCHAQPRARRDYDESDPGPPQLAAQLVTMPQLASLEVNLWVYLTAVAAALPALTGLQSLQIGPQSDDGWATEVLYSCGTLRHLTHLCLLGGEDESDSDATTFSGSAAPLTALTRLQCIQLRGVPATACMHAMPELVPQLSQLTGLELLWHHWYSHWWHELESAYTALKDLSALMRLCVCVWPSSASESMFDGFITDSQLRCEDALAASVGTLQRLTYLKLTPLFSWTIRLGSSTSLLSKLMPHLRPLQRLRVQCVSDLPVSYSDALLVVKEVQGLTHLQSVHLQGVCIAGARRPRPDSVECGHDRGRALSVALAQMHHRLVTADGQHAQNCNLVTLRDGAQGLDLQCIGIRYDVRHVRCKPKRSRQARW